jgi:uncharacterized membrane protein
MQTTMGASSVLTTRRIVVGGVLAAVALILSLTGWGFIPVPNITGSATILHVPAIVGGVLEGPIVGLAVGAIFGIFSWLRATSPLFANPLVSVFPRLFIGVTSAFTYMALKKSNEYVALTMAGVVGTITNTVLVLGMAILLGLLPAAAVPGIIPQAIAEIIIATIVTVAVVAAWKRLDKGAGKSSV